jgi:putative transport protein
MEFVIELLVEQPLLLLFLVMTLGYLLGEVHIKGIKLGVAAVLFVGLAFGALDPRLSLPPLLINLGLVLFVYCVGLASGPGFFASFTRSGLRDNTLVVVVLLLSAGMVAAEAIVFGFKSTIAAGMFAGALTNTPALAQLTSFVATTYDPAIAATAATEPVVGYSVAYPMGVIGPMLVLLLVQRLWKINYRADAEQVRNILPVEQEIYNRTVRVTNAEFCGPTVRDLMGKQQWRVMFGRIQRTNPADAAPADAASRMELITGHTVFMPGDLVSVIGAPEEVDAVVAALGEQVAEQLDADRSVYDFRRVFVSNYGPVGKRLADLHLARRFGAIVTRVRRGDIELLAASNLALELGDRVRVVAPRSQMRAISDFFGDSYKALSEINLLSLGLGITLGLIVGAIPIPLPGGVQFKLGDAGGPLIVALILSALRRTGPIVWSLPYSANLTIRQLGLVILLAGIGIRSGYTFLSTLQNSGGVQILLAGAAVSILTALLMIVFSHKLLRIPFAVAAGMVAAVHTQPAVQAFALGQAKNDLPNHGYALAFPMATIAKIVLAQLLVAFLPK